jgi:hypothetical protein
VYGEDELVYDDGPISVHVGCRARREWAVTQGNIYAKGQLRNIDDAVTIAVARAAGPNRTNRRESNQENHGR